MVERRGTERRESDQTVALRISMIEDDVRELREEFRTLKDDVREINRKIDRAFSDDGVIGQLNKRVGNFEIDKLSWKRVITILAIFAFYTLPPLVVLYQGLPLGTGNFFLLRKPPLPGRGPGATPPPM